MDKNVIPNTSTKFTGDTNTYFKRRSHITMFFRRLTPFWNTEMPQQRDQTKLLTTPQQEVKRCGTPTPKYQHTKTNQKMLMCTLERRTTSQ
jgi:hypothetical protein